MSSTASPGATTGHRRSAVTAVMVVTSALLVLVPAAAASAHVRVTPDTTTTGSYALLTFRVPNESDTASTTQLQVTLPTDRPFTYVAVQPVPGWTATVTEAPLPEPVEVEGTTITKAPATITWTAQEGAAIAPGQFQQFPISVGALPDAGTTVALPATQTYSDGSVVAWDEPVPASGEEPENPAPGFVTTAAEADRDGGGTAASSSSSSSSSSGSGFWLGLTGAVLGAAGLVVALVRRRATPAA